MPISRGWFSIFTNSLSFKGIIIRPFSSNWTYIDWEFINRSIISLSLEYLGRFETKLSTISIDFIDCPDPFVPIDSVTVCVYKIIDNVSLFTYIYSYL